MKKILKWIYLIIPFVSDTLYPSVNKIIKSDNNWFKKTVSIIFLIFMEVIPFIWVNVLDKEVKSE